MNLENKYCIFFLNWLLNPIFKIVIKIPFLKVKNTTGLTLCRCVQNNSKSIYNILIWFHAAWGIAQIKYKQYALMEVLIKLTELYRQHYVKN